MGDQLKEITGESDLHLQDLRMGIMATPGNIPASWTPHPEEHQMYSAERTRFTMNRHWEQLGDLNGGEPTQQNDFYNPANHMGRLNSQSEKTMEENHHA